MLILACSKPIALLLKVAAQTHDVAQPALTIDRTQRQLASPRILLQIDFQKINVLIYQFLVTVNLSHHALTMRKDLTTQ